MTRASGTDWATRRYSLATTKVSPRCIVARACLSRGYSRSAQAVVGVDVSGVNVDLLQGPTLRAEVLVEARATYPMRVRVMRGNVRLSYHQCKTNRVP